MGLQLGVIGVYLSVMVVHLGVMGVHLVAKLKQNLERIMKKPYICRILTIGNIKIKLEFGYPRLKISSRFWNVP